MFFHDVAQILVLNNFLHWQNLSQLCFRVKGLVIMERYFFLIVISRIFINNFSCLIYGLQLKAFLIYLFYQLNVGIYFEWGFLFLFLPSCGLNIFLSDVLIFIVSWLLSVIHDKLISSQSQIIEINVQPYQIQYKYHKNYNQNARSPHKTHFYNKFLIQMFSPQNYDANNIDYHDKESHQYHGQEISVILFSNAIVYPHAMMIEVLHTSATTSAMTRCDLNITMADLTIQHIDSLFMIDSKQVKNYESRSFRYLIMKSSEGSTQDVNKVIAAWQTNSKVSTTIMAIRFSNEKQRRWIIMQKNRNFIKKSKQETI